MVHVTQKAGFVLSACRRGKKLVSVKDDVGGWRHFGGAPRHPVINVVMPGAYL